MKNGTPVAEGAVWENLLRGDSSIFDELSTEEVTSCLIPTLPNRRRRNTVKVKTNRNARGCVSEQQKNWQQDPNLSLVRTIISFRRV